MSTSDPTLTEWQQLYEQAAAFKQLAPWGWMYDSEVFGVKDGDREEVGYCCVLGHRKEVFALVVYLGSEGLKTHQRIQSGEVSGDDDEALYRQKCLMASFEDRQSLDKEDLRVIKELHLTFRGKNEWPMFRNYEPGYAPWYLTNKEARFLSLALEQTIEVARRLQGNSDLLTPPAEGLFLVRVPQDQGDKTAWKDTWLEPAPLDLSMSEPMPDRRGGESTCPPLSEIRLKKIRQNASRTKQSWELDCFYSPSPVTDKGRPYFPVLCLCADSDSSFVLDFHLSENRECARREYPEKLLDILEKHGTLPDRFLVRSQEVSDLVRPIAEYLGMEVEHRDVLEAIDEVRESMSQYLSGHS